MEIYVATVLAKKGHDDEVAKFYLDQEEELKEAKGFRARQILKARTGAEPKRPEGLRGMSGWRLPRMKRMPS